jgi:hypothetical protein
VAGVADFARTFEYGFQVVPVERDGFPPIGHYALHGVTMNADGSLQVDLGGRDWRVTVKSTSPAKWMVDVEGAGAAALRPLTKEQHTRFFPKKDLGGSDAVSGEEEQPG